MWLKYSSDVFKVLILATLPSDWNCIQYSCNLVTSGVESVHPPPNATTTTRVVTTNQEAVTVRIEQPTSGRLTMHYISFSCPPRGGGQTIFGTSKISFHQTHTLRFASFILDINFPTRPYQLLCYKRPWKTSFFLIICKACYFFCQMT